MLLKITLQIFFFLRPNIYLRELQLIRFRLSSNETLFLRNNIVKLSGGYFLVDKKLSGCGCIQKLRVRVFFHYSFFVCFGGKKTYHDG